MNNIVRRWFNNSLLIFWRAYAFVFDYIRNSFGLRRGIANIEVISSASFTYIQWTVEEEDFIELFAVIKYIYIFVVWSELHPDLTVLSLALLFHNTNNGIWLAIQLNFTVNTSPSVRLDWRRIDIQFSINYQDHNITHTRLHLKIKITASSKNNNCVCGKDVCARKKRYAKNSNESVIPYGISMVSSGKVTFAET